MRPQGGCRCSLQVQSGGRAKAARSPRQGVRGLVHRLEAWDKHWVQGESCFQTQCPLCPHPASTPCRRHCEANSQDNTEGPCPVLSWFSRTGGTPGRPLSSLRPGKWTYLWDVTRPPV
ncbi:hypothetical protein H1C71_038436 [Ictidomys tridecemlineatus]|nr:hypothetical protein H1C71_038436 [Ictidomys tridecemlineatus]